MGSFGRHCLVATMKLLLLVFVVSSAAALETYTETRDITDSAGTTFSCLYTIVYDATRKVVYRRQSTVKCDPDTNGKQHGGGGDECCSDLPTEERRDRDQEDGRL